ncbi:FGGY-family carbohydrate kinase [Thiosocius teredinicola]|uniref:FGGY-family carbohydrate kinase n=1 Tax=Thiosocius teredinicola TaxID=1973002 RepID=UPI000F7B84E0
MPEPSTTANAYLGIDLGTSGCRAIVIDDNAAVVAESRAALPPSEHPADGAAEQSPEDWWQAVRQVVQTVIANVPQRIRALSIDGTSSSVLVCDRRGEPLTPALMYNDRQALAEARALAGIAPLDSAAQGPTSALAKALRLIERTPRERIAYVHHQADWIAACFTRQFGIADENNVLKLGYDVVHRRWPDWMDELPIDRDWLPRVIPVGSRIGVIDPHVADEVHLPRDLVVVAGTTDSNAAALAAGADAVGDAVTSLGSTLVLKVVSERPVYSAADGIYSHRLGDRWLVGGASNCGGAVLRQHFTDARLAELSERIDPNTPTGLDYYPLPATGERFPTADPGKRPVLSPRPDDDAVFLQAMLEGIAAIEAQGYRRLQALGAPYPCRVQTSGGGAVNTAWQQIRARFLGVPVTPAAHTEAAYGMALLARRGYIAAREQSEN